MAVSHSKRPRVVDDDKSPSKQHDGNDPSSGDEDAARPQPRRTRAKLSKAGGWKSTPSASTAALDTLAAAGSQSRMVQLQISSMLGDIRAPSRRKPEIDSVLRKLKNTIESLTAKEPVSYAEAERALAKWSKKKALDRRSIDKVEGVTIPFLPLESGAEKIQFEFQPVVYVDVVGSYVRQSYLVDPILSQSVESEISVDMVVCMPSAIFQEKDYLNFRYTHKRAYYVAVIAEGIKNSPLGKDREVEVEYSAWRGNRLQPIIVVHVKPAKRSASSDALIRPFRVNIIPTLQTPPPFPLRKLGRDKCSVRGQSAPTPFYNATVLLDCCIGPVSSIVRRGMEISPNFIDACILGQVWLRRRGFSADLRGHGFGSAEWAALLATLIGASDPSSEAKPTISPKCSAFQMFRAVLHFISSHDLCQSPYGVSSASDEERGAEAGPVFLIPGLGLNVLFKMSTGAFGNLREFASSSVGMLSKLETDDAVQGEDVFASLWEDLGQGQSRVGWHDLTISVALDDPDYCTPTSGFCKDEYLELVERATALQSVLSQGLSDRVRRVTVHLPSAVSWGVSRYSSSRTHEVTFGLSINPATADRLVDLGPHAEEKAAAAAYRKFWGDKAELRRFKDGSIRESCVWAPGKSEDSEQEERAIEQIVRYLVQKFCGFQALNSVRVWGAVDLLSTVTTIPASGPSASGCFQPAISAFQELHATIRQLDSADSLPLRIRSFMAADPQLRYSSIHTPSEKRASPADVVVQFEFSPRWPDDLAAIQRTKIAFLLKIADCLAENGGGYRAQLGLENGTSEMRNQGFLDIYTPDRFIFRARIQHEREEELLSKVLSSPATLPPLAAEAAIALSAYKTTYLRRPRHTAAIASAATRMPALSESIRLLKLWFGRTGLSPHFAPEAVELMAIHTFTATGYGDKDQPGSGVSGFVRTLGWLARWDWRKSPLMVTVADHDAKTDGDEITEDQPEPANRTGEVVKAAQTRFRAWRTLDPGLGRVAMFISTDIDSDGAAWTEGRPALVVAARLTSLARFAVETLRGEDGEAGFDGLFRSLFTPSWKGYDFVIHLNEKAVRANEPKTKAASGQFKNLAQLGGSAAAGTADGNHLLLSGDAVVSAYVDELLAAYGGAFVAFWDSFDGLSIGGIWNPAFGTRRWKPLIGHSTAPVDDDGLVELNKRAILGEVWRLGGDLVAKVDGF